MKTGAMFAQAEPETKEEEVVDTMAKHTEVPEDTSQYRPWFVYDPLNKEVWEIGELTNLCGEHQHIFIAEDGEVIAIFPTSFIVMSEAFYDDNWGGSEEEDNGD